MHLINGYSQIKNTAPPAENAQTPKKEANGGLYPARERKTISFGSGLQDGRFERLLKKALSELARKKFKKAERLFLSRVEIYIKNISPLLKIGENSNCLHTRLEKNRHEIIYVVENGNVAQKAPEELKKLKALKYYNNGDSIFVREMRDGKGRLVKETSKQKNKIKEIYFSRNEKSLKIREQIIDLKTGDLVIMEKDFVNKTEKTTAKRSDGTVSYIREKMPDKSELIKIFDNDETLIEEIKIEYNLPGMFKKETITDYVHGITETRAYNSHNNFISRRKDNKTGEELPTLLNTSYIDYDDYLRDNPLHDTSSLELISFPNAGNFFQN